MFMNVNNKQENVVFRNSITVFTCCKDAVTNAMKTDLDLTKPLK